MKLLVELAEHDDAEVGDMFEAEVWFRNGNPIAYGYFDLTVLEVIPEDDK